MDNIQIRPIADEDIASWHATLDTVCRERTFLAFVEAPPLAEARVFVRHNIAQAMPQWVAAVDRQIVGWCDVTPAADARRAGQLHVGRLGMGLLAAYRNRGIGARLLHATLKLACLRFSRIELWVYAHNQRAQRLYLKAGFVQEGVRREAWRLDGRVSDIIDMGLLSRDYVPANWVSSQ